MLIQCYKYPKFLCLLVFSHFNMHNTHCSVELKNEKQLAIFPISLKQEQVVANYTSDYGCRFADNFCAYHIYRHEHALS